jgi:serine/threonine-protein kinase
VATTGAVGTPQPPSEIASAPTLPAVAATGKIAPQNRIGRFTVTALLGAGGMGEVYAARDPELDRLIAIKLLRPELMRADARLRREARAMARLSHPNLVTVYDVGEHDGQLFVAMELIDGHTLRSWVRGRPWREIVRAYVAAGRGLAAAHEAGIVHRDFKPDNVLVGRDGRVAVGDFGLARTDDTEDPQLDDPAVADEHLTQAGALIGTVRYMAPEQLERRFADARSDEFAFCVALWEALDRHPFDDAAPLSDSLSSVDSRRDAIAAGLPRRRLRGVPATIARTLARGLAVDPADRWPSMTELLDELDAALARRRKIVAASAVVGSIFGAAAVTWLVAAPTADPCEHVADDMASVWKTGDVERLRRAFETTKRPGADETAVSTAAILDRHATAWTSMRIGVCAAEKASPELAEREAICFDLRLSEMRALVAVLTENPTNDIVDRAARAANNLRTIGDCTNAAAFLERAPSSRDPITRRRADALEMEIEAARIREHAGGRAPPGELEALEHQAIALGWDPAIAEIELVLGMTAWHRGIGEIAEAKFRASEIAAARAHDDVLVARSMSMAAEALIDADRLSDALAVAKDAEVACARAGDPPALRADVLDALGHVHAEMTKFDDSDRYYGQAVELLERSDVDPLHLARLLNNWANGLMERSDFSRSVPMSERAVGLFRQYEGAHHPDFARALQSYGNELTQIGKYAEAKARTEEALAIKEAVFGPDDPTVASALYNLGNAEGELANYDRAGQLFERAYKIWADKLGPDHSSALMARYAIGLNLKQSGKRREALAVIEEVLAKRRVAKKQQPHKIANALDLLSSIHFELGEIKPAIALGEEALAIREKVLGPETGDVAENLVKLAEYRAEGNDCPHATADAKRALAIYHKIPNGDAEMSGLPTLVVGACAAVAGKRDEAIASLRAGTELLQSSKRHGGERGRSRLMLADLLWPRDKVGAIAAAKAALDDLAGDPDQTAAKKWLAAHPN